MNKNEFKSLLTKVELFFNEMEGKIDYKDYSEYMVMHKIIDVIENRIRGKGKKLELVKDNNKDAN